MGKGMMDKGKGKGKGPAPMKGGGPTLMGPDGAPMMKPTNMEKGPDPSKKIYIGQIARKAGDNGFVTCDETFAIYGRDVYMWKTYFAQCQIGDWIKFNIHISEKGLPQVCWLERLQNHGMPMARKRPMDAGMTG